ncbi:MAG: YicC/YloC family endoribonuclease [Phycisphaerae bacterium]
MLASMTGFARASSNVDNVTYNLEIKALNGKYFKANIKLPEQLSCYEPKVEQLLREGLIRGSIVFSLRTRDVSELSAYQVNPGAVKAYLHALENFLQDQPGKNLVIDLANILELPGVCQYPDPDPMRLEREWQILSDLTAKAIEQLWTMRLQEGQSLKDDLLKHCTKIGAAMKKIQERAPLVIEDYAQRLNLRVKKLLAEAEVELDRQDLAREVAIFAERADVNEEISRLESHFQQFQTVIDSDEHAGRTLEFLSQEMLRETNTIGSKANDAPIAQMVIEIKGHIDRIKEQVMNVV